MKKAKFDFRRLSIIAAISTALNASSGLAATLSPDKEMMCNGISTFYEVFQVRAYGLARVLGVKQRMPHEAIEAATKRICDPALDKTPNASEMRFQWRSECMKICADHFKGEDPFVERAQMVCTDACMMSEDAQGMKDYGYREGQKPLKQCRAALNQVQELIVQNSSTVAPDFMKQIKKIIGDSKNASGEESRLFPAK